MAPLKQLVGEQTKLVFVSQFVPAKPLRQEQKYWLPKREHVPLFLQGFGKQTFLTWQRLPENPGAHTHTAEEKPIWTQAPLFKHGFGVQIFALYYKLELV